MYFSKEMKMILMLKIKYDTFIYKFSQNNEQA